MEIKRNCTDLAIASKLKPTCFTNALIHPINIFRLQNMIQG